MKLNGYGQGTIISDLDYAKIRKELTNKKHRLLLDIARYTGERWGALVQLRIDDVYSQGLPRDHITFRAAIRKAGPDGKKHTRQVPLHPHLRELLEAYSPPPATTWLFESSKRPGMPICLRAADLVFRDAVYKAGLDHKGYCTHSTRRTFITTLWERGVDLQVIQRITGHTDLKSLVRYIDIHPDQINKAIAAL